MAKFSTDFKAKLKAYFITRLGMFEYKHGWLKGTCPDCGRENKFGVNLSQNRTNCFRCGYQDPPINVIIKVEGFDTYPEAINFIRNNSEFEGYEFTEEKYAIRESKDILLPQPFKLLNQGDSQLAKSIRNYIINRGFDVNQLSRRGWGYSTDEKYLGYIIMPFYSNNKIVYFNARLVVGNGPRYNNPNSDITGLGKSFILYNSDALFMYNTVIICEGVFNAETIGERAIASGGKYLSRYQINQIIKSPVEKVIICLDSDAMDKAISLAYDLIDFKKIKIICFPKDKDANDLGKSQTNKLINSTKYIYNKQQLNIFKYEYKSKSFYR